MKFLSMGALVAVIAACASSNEIPKPKAPFATLDTVKVDAVDTTKFWAVYQVIPVTPTDGWGAVDSLITTATQPGVATQRHALRAVAQRDSFQFAKVAPNVTPWTGTYTAQQKRRSLLSSAVVRVFTALQLPDAPPPPPTVVGQFVLPHDTTIQLTLSKGKLYAGCPATGPYEGSTIDSITGLIDTACLQYDSTAGYSAVQLQMCQVSIRSDSSVIWTKESKARCQDKAADLARRFGTRWQPLVTPDTEATYELLVDPGASTTIDNVIAARKDSVNATLKWRTLVAATQFHTQKARTGGDSLSWVTWGTPTGTWAAGVTASQIIGMDLKNAGYCFRVRMLKPDTSAWTVPACIQ